MPIKFKCNSCSTSLQVKDELAGKKGRCPKCKSILSVPSQGSEVPANENRDEHSKSKTSIRNSPTGGGGSSKLMVQKMGEISVVTIMESRITELLDIREMGDSFMELLEQSEKPKVILDFSKVTYLPSAMIGKLTAMHKRAESYKGGLKFCSVVPGVMQIFKITRLHKVFNMHPDLNSALSSFKNEVTKA